MIRNYLDKWTLWARLLARLRCNTRINKTLQYTKCVETIVVREHFPNVSLYFPTKRKTECYVRLYVQPDRPVRVQQYVGGTQVVLFDEWFRLLKPSASTHHENRGYIFPFWERSRLLVDAHTALEELLGPL